jgi:type II secretion system protein C
LPNLMRPSTPLLLLLVWLATACERETKPVAVRVASGGAAALALSPKSAAAPSASAPVVQLGDTEIRLIAPGHYVVSRKLFDFWTLGSGPETLDRSSVLTPVEQDGRTVGLRLTRLKPSGWLQQLGLREGDVLVSLNGETLSLPGRAMEIYANLRKQPALKLQVLRGAQRVELFYEVPPG